MKKTLTALFALIPLMLVACGAAPSGGDPGAEQDGTESEALSPCYQWTCENGVWRAGARATNCSPATQITECSGTCFLDSAPVTNGTTAAAAAPGTCA